MDPETLVASALVAGATAGISGTMTKAVADAYESLKLLVSQCLSRGSVSEDAGQEFIDRAGDGDQDRKVLRRKLASTGVNELTIGAAQKLLDLLDTRWSKLEVQASNAKGVQVGDHNTQHNNFN